MRPEPARRIGRHDGLEAFGWYDHYSGEAKAEFTANDGKVLSWKIGTVRLCATWPEENLFDRIVRDAVRDAGLPHARRFSPPPPQKPRIFLRLSARRGLGACRLRDRSRGSMASGPARRPTGLSAIG